MKRVIFVFACVLVITMNWGCPNPITIVEPDPSKVTLTFDSDSILYRGHFYRRAVTVDTNALLTVVKQGQVFFFSARFGQSRTSVLNDTISALSILARLVNGLRPTTVPKVTGTVVGEIAGVRVTQSSYQEYVLENLKVRAVCIKRTKSSGSSRVLMYPKDTFVDNLISYLGQVTVLGDAKSGELRLSVLEPELCEAFGSVMALPLLTSLIPPNPDVWQKAYDKSRQSFQADPDATVYVNMVDGISLWFDVIEDITDLVETPCDHMFSSGLIAVARTAIINAITVPQGDVDYFRQALEGAKVNLGLAVAECAAEPIKEQFVKIISSLTKLSTVEVQLLLHLIPSLADQLQRAFDISYTDAYGKIALPVVVVGGTWVGKVGQEGDYLYDCRLSLSQNADSLAGHMRLDYVANPVYYGEFDVAGSVIGDSVFLHWTKTNAQRLPLFQYWCQFRTAQKLTTDPDSLNGEWYTHTNCVARMLPIILGRE